MGPKNLDRTSQPIIGTGDECASMFATVGPGQEFHIDWTSATKDGRDCSSDHYCSWLEMLKDHKKKRSMMVDDGWW